MASKQPNNLIRALLCLLVLTVPVASFANRPSQCDQPMHSDHIIYDCYGDWAVRHVFERGLLTHKYSDAKTVMDVGWFGSTEFQINRRQDGSVYYIIPSQIDRVELTIGSEVFVSEQAPSSVFYGEVSEAMLLAMSQASLPIQLLIFSEGQTTAASFSGSGSSAALRWIGAID